MATRAAGGYDNNPDDGRTVAIPHSVVLPSYPEHDIDQGDPFLFEDSQASSGFRYFVIVSSRGFRAYGSNQPTVTGSWTFLGESFPGVNIDPWAWAPCVRHVPELKRPWVMLYSLAAGSGDPLGHQFHQVRRADSLSPAGPYHDSGEVLTADIPFAIDPDVTVRTDGNLWLTCAADYVDHPPYGTGLYQARVSPDMRQLETPLQPLARGHFDWQVYLAERSLPWMSIPGVDWAHGDTVRWYTIEGPSGLVTPSGRDLLLYSGGNFGAFYAVGMLLLEDDGTWTDLSPEPVACLVRPDADHHVLGPGHCSVSGDLIAYHFRSQPDAPRQFTVATLRWDSAGNVPSVPGPRPAGAR